GHPVAAVRDEHAVAGRARHFVQLLGQAEVVDGLCVALFEARLLLRLAPLAIAQRREPRAGLAGGGERRLELPQDAARVTHDPYLDRAVAPDLAPVRIGPDDLGRLDESS